jgi:PHD/YefM family antitoxin component YafN of YafNO toxin-antitoxin module
MAITITSSRVQQNFGEAMDRALVSEDVVVERYGVPRVAIVSYERYRQLLEAERELLRTRLQQASVAVAARAARLSDVEVDAVIEQARAEANGE